MTRRSLRAGARRLEDESDQRVDELLGFLEDRAADLSAGRAVGGPLLGEAVQRIVGNARLFGARALAADAEADRRRAGAAEVTLLDACLDLANVFRDHDEFQPRWVR